MPYVQPAAHWKDQLLKERYHCREIQNILSIFFQNSFQLSEIEFFGYLAIYIHKKTRWSPRTRMQTRSKSYICPNDTLVGHSCGTLLWVTLVGNSCGTLLRDTFVGHSCGTLLWDTLVGHSCGTLLWDTLVGNSCGTLL